MSNTQEKKSRVKVGKLALKKETVKELTEGEAQGIQGGNDTIIPNCTKRSGCGPNFSQYTQQTCPSYGQTVCGGC